MARQSRRALLAALAFGLAGCSDSGTGNESGGDSDATGGNGEAGEDGGDSGDGDDGADGADGKEETDSEAEIHSDYETTAVRVVTPEGEKLGSVTAAIADTADLRYLGLSDTESLPEDRGMLFVYDSVGNHTFVMREMDFPIDIVYADDEGVITEIHHARAPGPDEDGNDLRYPGRGQYVLELVRNWTTERGVEVGDVLEFEL